MLILLVIVAKQAWTIYLAIKHPETYREMQQDRRQRRGKAINAGLGITKFIGKRKGWW